MKKIFASLTALLLTFILTLSVAACDGGNKKITEINLNKSELALAVGQEERLIATVEPEDAADKQVKWTSNSPEIATVNEEGTVKAISLGSTTIFAEAGGITAHCTVTVTQAVLTAEEWTAAINEIDCAKNLTMEAELKVGESWSERHSVKMDDAKKLIESYEIYNDAPQVETFIAKVDDAYISFHIDSGEWSTYELEESYYNKLISEWGFLGDSAKLPIEVLKTVDYADVTEAAGVYSAKTSFDVGDGEALEFDLAVTFDGKSMKSLKAVAEQDGVLNSFSIEFSDVGTTEVELHEGFPTLLKAVTEDKIGAVTALLKYVTTVTLYSGNRDSHLALAGINAAMDRGQAQGGWMLAVINLKGGKLAPKTAFEWELDMAATVGGNTYRDFIAPRPSMPGLIVTQPAMTIYFSDLLFLSNMNLTEDKEVAVVLFDAALADRLTEILAEIAA